MKKLSRRKFVHNAAVVAAGLALSGCGPTATPTTAPTSVPAAPTAVPATPTTVPAAATKVPVTQPTVVPTKGPAKIIGEIVVGRNESLFHPLKEGLPSNVAATEATGIKLKLQPIPDADYSAKLESWLATKQVPDLVRANLNQIQKYGDPSVLQPVLPLIDKYGPNLKKYFEANPFTKRWALNGQQYLVPCTWYNWKRLAAMPMFRMDRLQKAGLQVPTDFDQLYQVLRELKKAFPDMLGWTCRLNIKRLLEIAAYPMGSGLGETNGLYYDKDVGGGKWLYGPIHEEFKDVLTYFAKLYKEGLLDPDVANTTFDQWHEKNSSKALFTWDNFSFGNRWNLALRTTEPTAAWAPVPVIKGAKGARNTDYSGPGGSWAVGANCKNPELVIRFLDWTVTPLGMDTFNWGIEGVHYTLKSPRPDVITDYSTASLHKLMDPTARQLVPAVFQEFAGKADPFRAFQAAVGAGPQNLSVLFDTAPQLLWDKPGEQDKWYEMTEKDPGLHASTMAPPLTADEISKLKKAVADVSAVMQPAMEKVVLGQMSLTDYDKAVQSAIKAGAQDMEKIYGDAEARIK